MQIEKLRRQALDELFDAILTLENREECYEFFDDLCTVNEIQSLSQRLQVAKMIKQGFTYATIEKESGASTATISRVKRSLQWGNDAYTMILDRLNIETKE
ncbi:YerC/YecD family TrpR-related protein [Staphylococcus sp. Marseille-Q1834]|uniref:YerC/YecD family TrpR-related protein n=1 Tax=Staphylococcus sp. Marseille-Q1834 TaxID=2866594 RepID=UPI0012B85535|nr:YerC/YecD family TrpR-related protein [Staphylococcus sp. Marseille-Q1834]